MTTFAEKAQPLIQRGVPVFSCKPDKAPYTRNGFKDATTDANQIAAWSEARPGALVGVPTDGRGTFVLDIDRGHADGADGFATLTENGWSLPATCTHTTKSGGAHVFFKMPEGVTIRSSAGKIGAGLDIRGSGGYVIYWPAEDLPVKYQKTVADAPGWLLARLEQIGSIVRLGTGATTNAGMALSTTLPAPIASVDNDDLGGGPLDLSMPELTTALSKLDPDMGYSDWVKVGQALHHETNGSPAGLNAWVAWSSPSDKFPGRDELAAKWAGFGKFTGEPVTARTLLKLARESGADIPTRAATAGATAAASPNDEQSLARLAALPLFEYERVRKDEADRLGVRATALDTAVQAIRDGHEKKDSRESVFDDVVPWDDPVDGAALLYDMVRTIGQFIVCDGAAKVATALWCAAAWLVAEVHASPLLLINAPEKACGKTQLLTVVGKLVPRPAQAAGISPSVLFRMIEKYHPTLLVDEIETVLTKEAEDLRGLFNAGHTRDSAYVWRSVPLGDDFEPRRFSVFGFKAIAGINADRLAETVTSRAIVVHLRRRLPHETAQRLRHAEPGLFDTLKRKLARWSVDNAHAIRTARVALPEQLSDRDQDNWEPLIAVADLAGGPWGDIARKAAIHTCITNKGSNQSAGAELLADVKAVFNNKQVTRISMQELRSALCADEEAPWATWSKGNPISARRLGQLLRQYGIESTTVKLANGFAPKGYRLEDCQDAFGRYLYTVPVPPISSVT